jgi:hypothetical protein
MRVTQRRYKLGRIVKREGVASPDAFNVESLSLLLISVFNYFTDNIEN